MKAKLDVELLVERISRCARAMDMGDVFPKEGRISLTSEELTDLLVDAWHLGKRDTIESIKRELE